MLINQNRPKYLSIVHAVALDLSSALEEEVSKESRKQDEITVLAGCYTIIDYTANLLAKLGVNDDEYPEAVGKDHYLVAPELMKDMAIELESNLQDDNCPLAIDYRKVQALAAFLLLIPHIERLAEIV